MKRRRLIARLGYTVVFGAASAAHSEVYLSREQARNILLPGAVEHMPVTLTKEQKKAIEKAGDVDVESMQIDAWKSADGSWLIFDSVSGRYEFIDIAFAISPGGEARGVEILTYREAYGYEVRNPKWRRQFHGKIAGSKLKLDKDISNISGATISSKSITSAVKRLLHTWEQVLREL